MGEKVINPKKDKPREYVIPIHPGSKNQKEVTLILPDDKEPKDFEIVKKSIPQAAWDKGKSKKITWINNFGIKKNNKFVGEIDYQIVADAPPDPKKMWYYFFDGKNVQRFPEEDVVSSGNKWVLTMHSGDPAVGWGGSGG